MPSSQPLSPLPLLPRRTTVDRVPLRTYLGQPVLDVESISSDSSGLLDINESAFGMNADNAISIPPNSHTLPSRSSTAHTTTDNPQETAITLPTNMEPATAATNSDTQPPPNQNNNTTPTVTTPTIDNGNPDNPSFVRVDVLPHTHATV